ncbi:hypothetical protein J6590_108238 [Homalodisca vitripennis]|nr:hypothetical protein J6590_108238 [Homalodisca vitripennis]
MHHGTPISIYDLAEIFGKSYPKAFTHTNIQAGFRVSGIWPINRNIFTDDEFLSSSVSDRPLPVQAQLEADDPGLMGPTTRPTLDTTSSDLLENRPSTSGTNISNEAQPTKSVKLTPEQVRPYPKAPPRKMTGKRGGRKPGRCRILTDTPEKLEIMAIKQEKVSKKAGKLASKEKTNEKINSLKVRSKPIVLTCKNQNQGRKFLTFDDSSTSDEDIPEEDSDSVDDICDWPPQPMESDDGIDKPVQAGDFCLTLLSGKKSTWMN